MDDFERETLKKIGARIKEIRVQRHISQQELAARVGISLPTVSEIERGNSNMRLTNFIRIAEVLQVSSDSLLRVNVPSVNEIYQGEFTELLKDCKPTEIDAIIRVVKEVKTTLHTQQNTED